MFVNGKLKLLLSIAIISGYTSNLMFFEATSLQINETKDYIEAIDSIGETVEENVEFNESEQVIESNFDEKDIESKDINEINSMLAETGNELIDSNEYASMYNEYIDSINVALDSGDMELIDDEIYITDNILHLQGGKTYSKVSLKGATLARNTKSSGKMKKSLSKVGNAGVDVATIASIFCLVSNVAKVIVTLIYMVSRWAQYASSKIRVFNKGMIMTIKPYGAVVVKSQ